MGHNKKRILKVGVVGGNLTWLAHLDYTLHLIVTTLLTLIATRTIIN